MELAAALIATFIGGALLTRSRRMDNDDSDAGVGVAAWTVIIAILIVLGMT